jgi:hypothetical protein
MATLTIQLPDTRRILLLARIIAACRQSHSGRITGTLTDLSRLVGMTVVASDLNALFIAGRIVYGLRTCDEFVVRTMESGR